jgi:hypothetical protein
MKLQKKKVTVAIDRDSCSVINISIYVHITYGIVDTDLSLATTSIAA